MPISKPETDVPWTKDEIKELRRLIKEAASIYKKSSLLLDKIYTKQTLQKIQNIKKE